MQAVLYVGHGSRVKNGVEQAKLFLRDAIKKIPVDIQEISFLELAEPTILEGVERCIRRGATKIAVIPVLLLTAVHAKVDIPEEVEKVKEKYPYITFTIGKPLGVHERIIDILVERMEEKSRGNVEGAHVLLIGRGSSDKDQIQDLYHIASLLERRKQVAKVEICFLAAANPNLEEGIQKVLEAKSDKVYVLPYLLFTGILMNTIRKSISSVKDNETDFAICRFLGFHPLLIDVLATRVSEVLSEELVSRYKLA